MRKNKGWKLAAGVVALSLAAVACGGSDSSSTESSAPADCETTTAVKLQLQWFTQAQFAGYFAAVDQGFYAAQCLEGRPRSEAMNTPPK